MSEVYSKGQIKRGIEVWRKRAAGLKAKINSGGSDVVELENELKFVGMKIAVPVAEGKLAELDAEIKTGGDEDEGLKERWESAKEALASAKEAVMDPSKKAAMQFKTVGEAAAATEQVFGDGVLHKKRSEVAKIRNRKSSEQKAERERFAAASKSEEAKGAEEASRTASLAAGNEQALVQQRKIPAPFGTVKCTECDEQLALQINPSRKVSTITCQACVSVKAQTFKQSTEIGKRVRKEFDEKFGGNHNTYMRNA
jgi:hypothetical protein